MHEPPIEGEAHELPLDEEPQPMPPATPQHGTELVARPAATTALIQGATPEEVLAKATAIATALDGVIKAQNLSVKIGPKDHVQIEAWQTLATLLGAAPIIRWTRRVIDPATGKPERVSYEVDVTDYEWVTVDGKRKKQEKARRQYQVDGYSWEACCDVIKDGAVIASAESMVSRSEDRWQKADDYAVRSMAQTRAQSRAISAAARWVVTLAGYSGTPAEEITPEMQENGAEANGKGASPLLAPVKAGKAIEDIKKDLLYLMTGEGPLGPGEQAAAAAAWKAVHELAGGTLPALAAEVWKITAGKLREAGQNPEATKETNEGGTA